MLSDKLSAASQTDKDFNELQSHWYKQFNRNHYIFCEIPAEFQTTTMVDKLLAMDPLCLIDVPDFLLTEDHVVKAIGRDARASAHIPKLFRLDAMFIRMYDANPAMFQWMPDKLKTEYFCKYCLAEDPTNIRHVPIAILDKLYNIKSSSQSTLFHAHVKRCPGTLMTFAPMLLFFFPFYFSIKFHSIFVL